MSNLILPDQHAINAINESRQHDGTGLILDQNLRPISSKDMPVKDDVKRFKHVYPIGADYRYYKMKSKANPDKWMVGYVKGRRIPSGGVAIETKTAFEMMYGVKFANSKGNKHTWGNLSLTIPGHVIVETEQELYKDLPNPNDEVVMEKISEEAKIVN